LGDALKFCHTGALAMRHLWHYNPERDFERPFRLGLEVIFIFDGVEKLAPQSKHFIA
jgi:hypothetical protein